MPLMDGMELIDKLQEIRPHFPIILCSATFTRSDQLPMGVSFLSKPYQLQALLEQMDKALFEGIGEPIPHYYTLPSEISSLSVWIG